MIKLLLLLLFGGLKGAKLGTTGVSMLVSLALYASIWGWRFAAGFIACLFVHEMGHVIAARQRGLAVSAPAFIPFMGAFITMRDAPPDVETEAHVAIGGPLLGSIAAFGFYFAGQWDNDRLLLAIAYSGFVLNLFNLLPISPLDGGRIVAVLGPRIWLAGVPLLVALFAYRPSPMLLVIALFAAPRILQAWRYQKDAPENRAYYAIPAAKKFEYGGMYLGMVVTLAIMAYEVHAGLTSTTLPPVWYPRSGA
jgi:Zn-dependent protease